MADAAVAADITQADDVLLHLATERPLDRVLAVEDAGQTADLVLGKIFRAALRVHFRLGAKLQGRGAANSVNVPQGNMRRLVGRNIHSQNTRHADSLSLALSIPGAACAVDCCKSRTLVPVGGRSCSSHRSASRSNGLSSPSRKSKIMQTMIVATPEARTRANRVPNDVEAFHSMSLRPNGKGRPQSCFAYTADRRGTIELPRSVLMKS